MDLVWIQAAARLGLRVAERDDVFASWDGRGTLWVCPPSAYDADDSLAQLIFHELCHALVQGPARRAAPDWGLDNTDDAGCATAEHAAHRVQAALADRYGLRELLAVTTDWRSYWDALGDDPLAGPEHDPAVALARTAWPEALRGPWSAAIHDALRRTAAIAAAACIDGHDSLWARAVPRHPTGVAQHRDPTAPGCGACAWNEDGVCLAQDSRPSVLPAWGACLFAEAAKTDASCRTCAACCREGYHRVEVSEDEPLVVARPDLVARDAWGPHLPRPGGRCTALAGGPPAETPWTCVVYSLRPTACRELAPGSEACLVARRRVGLSRA